jgi:kumamolisin
MEPVPSRNTEATLDPEWAGALAPSASLVVYAGPDSRNTSMVYDVNEAIGRGDVDILTDSFAHRENSEPDLVVEAYDRAAEMGAALGITVISAAGDSGKPDTPCASPYVTCVGGTDMEMRNGAIVAETAWDETGTGDSETFSIPWWQMSVVPRGTMRAVNDVAMPGGSYYWVYYLSDWQIYAGTSFAAPTFAGLMAVVDSARADAGLPMAGYLNPILYTDTGVQAAFHDVTSGGTRPYTADAGWDYPTGWGSPDAQALAAALP